ncbi:unnamed protein product [Paramecium primaurelia]|uniref:Replication protein A OB domain-containing protein n=1 Tax=Paramecium primaurelia TaxID=5886 RepID=A0A8S1KB15_PARPR|nr:unnamed protein product [Paramecium primaurelia]
MKQKRYSNFLDQEEYAQFQYHEGISKSNNQKCSNYYNRISELNNRDQNLYVNRIYNTNNLEKAKGLKDIKRQHQLYQIALKFKKILNEDFIQNQKLVEFKDPYGQQCTCLIGNEVEYPQFKNNEVYYLFGVQIKESINYQKNLQIMIQKGKITQYPPDDQMQQTQQLKQEQKNNSLDINQSNSSLINQLQLFEQPQQNTEIKTYFNILAIVIQQFDRTKILSQKCRKYFDFVKIEVMDQDGYLVSITLWNTFLEYKFTPYQIVFFQNLELKSYKGQQYLQTIDRVSKIIIDDSRLQLLSNYYEVKEAMIKHQENEKFKKLITYQEIQQLNPI